MLGVGINVAQTNLSHAGQPAVSLALLGLTTDAEKILHQVCDRFFARYENVLQNGFSAIRTDYLTFFPYLGKEVEIRHGIKPAHGTVKMISPDGELILNTPAGQTIISIGDMCV